MAITPPSDIVLGVALAADPQKYRAAAERLRRLSSVDRVNLDTSEWQASVVPQSPQDGARATVEAVPASPASPLRAARPPRQVRNAPDAFGKLEAFVLQTFIQQMLPKNASHVFGKGTAGEIWKSMLAEKLANEIAKSGQVGLAKRLQAGMVASRAGPAASGAGTSPLLQPASLASVLPYLQAAPTGQAGAAVVPGSTSPDGARS